MKHSPSLQRAAMLICLAAIYYVAAKVGLQFAFVNTSVTTIWPPAGIALAAFLLLGYRVWPAIFVAAFLANFSTTGAVLSSTGIAVGNTLEGLAGAYLVNRFARGGRVFDRPRDIFGFTVLAALSSTTVSATLPETGEAAAWHVARSVVDRLATDAEKPNVSISVGVAAYPGNGETVEALLNAADVALYETKERRKSKPSGLAP